MSDTETHRFNKLRRPLKELRRRRRGIGGRRWRPRPLLRVHAATRGHAAPRLQRRHQQHGLLHGQYGRPIFSFTGTIKETNAPIGMVLLLCLFRRLWQLADRSTGRSTDGRTDQLSDMRVHNEVTLPKIVCRKCKGPLSPIINKFSDRSMEE